MASVAPALAQIKRELRHHLPDASIRRACQQVGYSWRQRQHGPVQTIHLFILQVVHFNTAMTALRHLSHMAVKAPAYCKARMRLPLAVLQILLIESTTAMRRTLGSSGRWRGLRAHLVDGSSTIAPDTPDSQRAFGQPRGCKRGCGFPVPKVLGLFDTFSGLIVQVLGYHLFTHEQSKVWQLHPLLGIGDLLVGDRGLCSYVHLALLGARGVMGLFRMHQMQIVDFRPHRNYRSRYSKKPPPRRSAGGKRVRLPRSRFVKRLGRWDQIVEWFRPRIRPKWMSPAQFTSLPTSLLVRELRYMLPQRGQRTLTVTIVTTLLDPARYPKEAIGDLYGVRWRAETHFAQLKTTLKMRKVKSKTPSGVLKELIIYAIVYNLVHMVMLRAAQRQGVEPHRISFIDALRWLSSDSPFEQLTVIPHRPNRHEPRVVKDREDTYTKMTRPRGELRDELRRSLS
jgi:hypothetical protein